MFVIRLPNAYLFRHSDPSPPIISRVTLRTRLTRYVHDLYLSAFPTYVLPRHWLK